MSPPSAQTIEGSKQLGQKERKGMPMPSPQHLLGRSLNKLRMVLISMLNTTQVFWPMPETLLAQLPSNQGRLHHHKGPLLRLQLRRNLISPMPPILAWTPTWQETLWRISFWSLPQSHWHMETCCHRWSPTNWQLWPLEGFTSLPSQSGTTPTRPTRIMGEHRGIWSSNTWPSSTRSRAWSRWHDWRSKKMGQM